MSNTANTAARYAEEGYRNEQIVMTRKTLSLRGNKSHKSKPTPKGHEAFLKALESSEAIVNFEKISSGVLITGKIKHSDKYTISVTTEDGQTHVLFKHDLSEFWTEAKQPNQEEKDAQQ